MLSHQKELSIDSEVSKAYVEMFQQLNELPRFRVGCTQLTHLGCWTGYLSSEFAHLQPNIKRVNLLDASSDLLAIAKRAVENFSNAEAITENALLIPDMMQESSGKLSFVSGYARISSALYEHKAPEAQHTIDVDIVKHVSELLVSRTTWFKPNNYVMIQMGRISAEIAFSILGGQYIPGVLQFQVTKLGQRDFPEMLKQLGSYGYVVPKTAEFHEDDAMLEIVATRYTRGFLIRHKRVEKPVFLQAVLDNAATNIYSKPRF